MPQSSADTGQRTMTRDQALALGRAIGAPLGGRAVGSKTPPAVCPHPGCGRSMAGRTWHSYLGHLGLHGLADNWFCGDLDAAALTSQGIQFCVDEYFALDSTCRTGEALVDGGFRGRAWLCHAGHVSGKGDLSGE